MITWWKSLEWLGIYLTPDVSCIHCPLLIAKEHISIGDLNILIYVNTLKPKDWKKKKKKNFKLIIALHMCTGLVPTSGKNCYILPARGLKCASQEINLGLAMLVHKKLGIYLLNLCKVLWETYKNWFYFLIELPSI